MGFRVKKICRNLKNLCGCVKEEKIDETNDEKEEDCLYSYDQEFDIYE